MRQGDNNPRVFADTISLDTWRRPFDGASGEADLHVDVVFAEQGRVGGPGEPVRFRLSLRRAEIHVILDDEGILGINAASVRRSALPIKKFKATEEQDSQFEGSGGGKISPNGISVGVAAKAKGQIRKSKSVRQEGSMTSMEVTHWKTERGYSFRLSPSVGDRLKLQPWSADERCLTLRDTNFERKRGESPEARIEIHCRREDLIIENVEFPTSKTWRWSRLGRKKQVAVEQYIKAELQAANLPVDDVSDPFARLVLADAMPSVAE